MKSDRDADKLAAGAGNSSNSNSSSSSWLWWRHKRRPTEAGKELDGEESDDELALASQQLPSIGNKSSKAKSSRTEGKCKSNNNSKGNKNSESNNGIATVTVSVESGCELRVKANNNSQSKELYTSKLEQQQQQQSYSKRIFNQYLPASPKVNNNNNNNDEDDYENNIQADDAKLHQPRPQSSSSRVVSALSKLSGLKGSSSSFYNNQSQSNSHFISSSSNQKLSEESNLSGEDKRAINIKRKGFLYLKKPRETTFDIVQRGSSKLVTKIRDLNNNNNNNNNSNSNSCNGGQNNFKANNYETAHNEHKARLIEDSDSEDSNSGQQTLRQVEEAEYLSQQQRESSLRQNYGNKMRRNNQISSQKGDGPLLTVALFVAIGIVVCLASSAAIKSALALQSPQVVPPPSFVSSRSQQQQQPPASSGSPLRDAGGLGGEVAPSSRPLPQPAAGSLVANVNCNKIRGHVTLTPNLQGGTTISAQISAGPPGEFYQWSVHQFPVKPGAAMCSCSALILGSKLIDMSQLHGNLPSEQEQNVQSSINLFGPESPVGHSLMLRGLKTGLVACATFLPTSRKSNYRAKFHIPLSGSVTIFQTAFGTSFTSHLMYSNGTRRHSIHQFDLVKSDDDMIIATPLQPVLASPSGGSSRTGNNNQQEQSFEQLAQREHDNELNQCRRLLRVDASGEALLRNSSYQLSVSTENFGMRGRTSMVLPQIPFETFSSVYVVIYSEYNSNEPIACAPLRFVKPKQAAAKFQSVSVQGSVTFTQDSPYDVTVARINLNLPNSDGHSYGIDELPMIIRRKSDTRVCPNIREIIYNPHHVEPSSVPPEGEATSDQYAVGDLSGKYGSLTGKSSEKIQVNDYNLPLFGATSIIGRAMTIYSADGVAIACSNVELTTPMTTAFATFDFGIQGQFIFRQPANDCNGDTYVYIEVSKPVVSTGNSQHNQQLANNDANLRSLDHNWHIHVNPVDSGLDHLSSVECSPAGGHYNPYNISTSGIYSRDCTPFNVLRCELGDLSSKMFTIDIPPYKVKGGQEPDIGKFFGTDIDLPLCGPVSVVNRSVVVHVQDFGMQRLACSTVIEFKPRSNN